MLALLLGLALAGVRAAAQQTSTTPNPSRQVPAIPSPFAEAETLLRQGAIEEAKQKIQEQLGLNPRSVAGYNPVSYTHLDVYKRQDLYIANGYISGSDHRDLESFFWRQVVANSPPTSTASLHYEHGWNAINELIRSDVSWSRCV